MLEGRLESASTGPARLSVTYLEARFTDPSGPTAVATPVGEVVVTPQANVTDPLAAPGGMGGRQPVTTPAC